MENKASRLHPSEVNTTSKTVDIVKDGLHLAAQLILASPLKLPVKLIQGAKYVVLAISLFDGLLPKKTDQDETLKPSADEADRT